MKLSRNIDINNNRYTTSIESKIQYHCSLLDLFQVDLLPF